MKFSQAEIMNEVMEFSKSDKENQMVIEKLQSRVAEQEGRANIAEDYSRRKNLRITDIHKKPGGETWEETTSSVSKLLEDKLQLATADLDRAYRVRPVMSSQPREIVVRLEKFRDREAVLRSVKNLEGADIYVNEDLCPASRKVKKSQTSALRHGR